MNTIFREPRGAVLCVLLLFSSSVCAEELNVLAYQNPGPLSPVLEVFQQETGIQVNVQYLSARDLRQELESGSRPADVIVTMEAKRLAYLVKAVVLAPVQSSTLKRVIPAHFRHPQNLWFAVSKWSRSVFYAPDRVRASKPLPDLSMCVVD